MKTELLLNYQRCLQFTMVVSHFQTYLFRKTLLLSTFIGNYFQLFFHSQSCRLDVQFCCFFFPSEFFFRENLWLDFNNRITVIFNHGFLRVKLKTFTFCRNATNMCSIFVELQGKGTSARRNLLEMWHHKFQNCIRCFFKEVQPLK